MCVKSQLPVSDFTWRIFSHQDQIWRIVSGQQPSGQDCSQKKMKMARCSFCCRRGCVPAAFAYGTRVWRFLRPGQPRLNSRPMRISRVRNLRLNGRVNRDLHRKISPASVVPTN